MHIVVRDRVRVWVRLDKKKIKKINGSQSKFSQRQRDKRAWAFPASDWFCFFRPALLPPKIEVHTLCAVLGWAMVMHLITFWTSPRVALPPTCCCRLWVEVPSCSRRTSSCLFLIAAVHGDDRLLGCFVGISPCYLQRSNGMIGCDCKHNND